MFQTGGGVGGDNPNTGGKVSVKKGGKKRGTPLLPSEKKGRVTEREVSYQNGAGDSWEDTVERQTKFKKRVVPHT